jgi:hypothetical protein
MPHQSQRARQRSRFVLPLLFVFGIIYNHIVTQLERRHHNDGYTSLLVIAGSGVTIAAAGLLTSLQNALWTLACFSASGLPMTIGSIARHCHRRERANHILADQIRRNHNATDTT